MKEPKSSPGVQVFRTVVGENNSLTRRKTEDWFAYAEGFKLGADAIVRQVLETEKDWDYLAYPACFGYRHYLELKLKEIIRRGGWVVHQPDELHRPEHRLLPLWQRAKAMAMKIFPDEQNEVARVEQVIRQFDEIDPNSYAFRYPVNNQKRVQLEDLKGLSLRNLAQVMGEIAVWLDGVAYGIEDIRDAMQDALASDAEYCQYYADRPDSYQLPDPDSCDPDPPDLRPDPED